MPIVSYVVNVGTVATRLVQAAGNPLHLNIHADDNQNVYLGGSAVTSASGFPIQKNEELSLSLFPGNTLYAVSATPSQVIIFEQSF
jgi:hypothetical protein